MKEKNLKGIMESKYMIIFIILMLFTTYINSLGIQKYNKETVTKTEILYNK